MPAAGEVTEGMIGMSDDELSVQRRAINDYRLALGLDLKARRDAAGIAFPELANLAGIPAETLRSYERGTLQPQLVRLAHIGAVYGVSALDILIATAEYIYRASGEPIPDPRLVPEDKIALRAVVLYTGVTPGQLNLVESRPPQPKGRL